MRSFLVPGWGQLATGRPILGRVLVFVTEMLGIAALTVFIFFGPFESVEIAAWMADPDVLLGVVLFNLAFALVRLFSTELAWVAGGGRGLFIAFLLGLLVAVPHAAIAWVGLETRGSLIAVFEVSHQPIAAPAARATTTSSTTTTTAPIELSPIVIPPGQYEADQLHVSRVAPWQPFGTERLNILLLGGDAGPGRRGLRTDSMIVASIDPISGDTALFGVPRNYGNPTLTDGTVVPVTQLGHVYGWGRRHPDRFGGIDPGAGAVRDAVANITGLEIDYYFLVDLTGFAEVVDALGGVQVAVSKPVDAPIYDVVTGSHEMVHIPAGVHHLDGAHALGYSRARYGSTDYARMGRQRCLLVSLAAQADILSLFARLDRILDAVESNLTTDLPIEMVPDLIRLTPRVSAADIRMVGFDNTWGNGRTPRDRVIPDIGRIREAVRVTIEDPAGADRLSTTMAGEGC